MTQLNLPALFVRPAGLFEAHDIVQVDFYSGNVLTLPRDGKELKDGWRIEGDKLIFNEPPAKGTFIWLFYEF